jgi:hypothetical protein
MIKYTCPKLGLTYKKPVIVSSKKSQIISSPPHREASGSESLSIFIRKI